MSYNTRELARRVQSQLEANPCLHLPEVARNPGVHLRSVERALHEAKKTSFRELRNKIVLRTAILSLRREPGKSIKEIGFMLGYLSSEAFYRFIRISRKRVFWT